MRRALQTAALVGVLALTATACSSDKKASNPTATTTVTNSTTTAKSGDTTTSSAAVDVKGEGAVNVVAWAGYVENGANDPKVDWMSAWEKDTGCKLNVKVGNTSDEMVQLMQTGDYDVVSASGDATQRLMAGGDVIELDLTKVPNYADIFADLKLKPWNSKDGKPYGAPQGRGANLLMYNTDVVKTAPDSWGVVFDASSPYKGKVTAYDAPIYIADAAVYLKTAKPELKITNPYELDDKQFTAAVALLKVQKTIVGEYWAEYAKSQSAFEQGSIVLGTTWQVIANGAVANKAPVAVTLPKEGATGWSDTWMISSKSKHPNCAYKFVNHIVSPQANAANSEYFGEAPANAKACDLTSDKEFCKTFHASDESYFKNVYYWTTPVADCGDDRGKVCKTFDDWTKAWTEIKG